MMAYRTFALLTALCGSAALAATQFPPLKRTDLSDITLPAAMPVAVVKETKVSFVPRQPTGLHLHPVPVIGVVTAGSFIFQPEGQGVRTLHTGDTFNEPANTRILHFDNASASQPAAITAFYLADRPDQKTIELLSQ